MIRKIIPQAKTIRTGTWILKIISKITLNTILLAIKVIFLCNTLINYCKAKITVTQEY